MNKNDNTMLFWNENSNGGYGGIYFRSMGIGKFIQETREKGFNVVGIRFDPKSNNCELLCSNNPEEVER